MGLVGTGATFTAGAAGAGSCCVGTVCVVGFAVCVCAGFCVRFVFGLTRSGNNLGATTAHNHRKAIEISTATKILFSI